LNRWFVVISDIIVITNIIVITDTVVIPENNASCFISADLMIDR
jgi:hypothetical protein